MKKISREADAWLVSAAGLSGPNQREARLVIAALRDPDDHAAKAEAVEWLQGISKEENLRAEWAWEILEVVA